MGYLLQILRWFSGGKDQYMPLQHCLRHDQTMLLLVIVGCSLVLSVYVAIAWLWWRDEKIIAPSKSKTALNRMKWIFVLCALCGYGFPITKTFWPAWRLEVAGLFLLAYIGWRYVFAGGMGEVFVAISEGADAQDNINHFPQLSWIATPQGKIHSYNPQWYAYTGTTPEEMAEDGWRQCHDPEILPEVVRKWQHSLKTGEPFEMVFRLRRAKDKMFRWHLTRVVPIRDAAGNIVRWCGTNTDIHHVYANALQSGLLLAELKKDDRILQRLDEVTQKLNAATRGGV